MIKLPGYYYLSLDKSALISLNESILRALIADALEKAQICGFILQPDSSGNGTQG